jgi:hypothetical protein
MRRSVGFDKRLSQRTFHRASAEPSLVLWSRNRSPPTRTTTSSASLRNVLEPMRDWIQNASTQAEVKVVILDHLWQSLPRPPFTDDEAEVLADRVYEFVWQRSSAVSSSFGSTT